MNKIVIYIIITLFLGTVLAAAQTGSETTRIIITPHSTAKDSVIKAVQNNGGTFIRETLDNRLLFNIPSTALNNQISILTIPDADYIEEDVQLHIPTPVAGLTPIVETGGIIQLTPNDPLYPQQWGIKMIEANRTWDIIGGDPRIIVAVIDTGVDYTHEDLAAVNESIGYDFTNNDNNPMDDNGHGTHVAGIIAATMNNNKGVAGVANITIMPVKVCNSAGSCWTSDIADGIRWASDHGAKIQSISLGGLSPDQQTYDATKYAVNNGGLVIAAAGNLGVELPSYPGAYPWVLAVGALDSTGNRAYYSQYGSFLDIMAPGSNIISTVPKGTCDLCDPSGYLSISGTSMATPHVSGVAALFWSYNMGLTNKQIAYALLKTADDLGTAGWDKYYGYGRVDAYPQNG